ncbi:MraY family glycosyltransferase [Thermoflexus hugenholtzii]|jgi:UDP-N-acetylmuramyl pentapeptide phosphotransferase/UDP-N-acetylglucosamine-1-phosphate transferase|uniref:UDP-GlcNAc:undecaprenyl-phosphate GlcNAc-1-phosphate transferase n=1 Tax=Thermoflexus hugenholtzii JAD2 TaxID=877466 RepID=A0A212RSX7_9CHLR|nr:MraY family glycosyltransferase [Thermoflexus hugenholtzii]SNB75609.1 UDP-GlcNAc:undecaprenyl-phosphate GlcNAc-1-phosphate transferase [Thermoflexus hugenholtzii JAD2]
MRAQTAWLVIFLGALAIALVMTPVARAVAVRVGMVDHPASRKLHTRPIPLLGGLALYLAVLLALLLFEGRYNLPQLAGILAGATAISFLGIWDDRWGMRPLIKLAGQVLIAGVVMATGVTVSLFPWPILNLLVTLLWLVGITNAFNLIDNMDGLSGGIGAVAAAFFLLLAALNGQYLVGAMAAAVLGACIGFLRYNFNPASIFMGDAGSLFLGFLMAVLGIKLRFPNNVAFVTWMVPVLVLGIPIFDTALVVLSRLRRGLNPLTTPGKDHLSHRLVRAGLTHREAVLTLYLAQVTLGVLAMFVAMAGALESYLIGGLVVGFALWALWRLEQPPFFEPPARR